MYWQSIYAVNDRELWLEPT